MGNPGAYGRVQKGMAEPVAQVPPWPRSRTGFQASFMSAYMSSVRLARAMSARGAPFDTPASAELAFGMPVVPARRMVARGMLYARAMLARGMLYERSSDKLALVM